MKKTLLLSVFLTAFCLLFGQTTPASIYVNDNSTMDDVYTTAVGLPTNPGTASAPVATITQALALAQEGDVIYVDAGTFTEQVTINKGIRLMGAGSALTTIALPATSLSPSPGFAEYGVVQTAGDISNVTIQDFTIDGKNIGANGPVWGVLFQTGGFITGCEIKNMANNGVFVRYTGATSRTVNVSNNYIHHFKYMGINCQGAALAVFTFNNKIDGTGGPFIMAYTIGGDFGPVAEAIVFSNEIPYYNGWGIKVNSRVAHVEKNSLTGAAPAIQNEGPGSIAATCNWFGTTDKTVIAGKITGHATYGPWLIDGTDADPASIGFQPTLTACVGNNTEFYVNDNSQTGDRFTTAIGNDNNPGTKEAPFATLLKANSVAPVGSTIYVDAGNFDFGNAGYFFSKAMTFLGTNYDKSPNNAVDKKLYNSDRNAETNLLNFTAIINSNYLSFDGFTFAVGNRNAILLSNSATTNNDFGNATFKKNVFRISSTLPQFSITGKFVTSPAMPVTSGYVIEDNRFEKRDTSFGTTMNFSFIKNITVDNNAFIVTGPKFRTQTAMNFGGAGIVAGVTVTGNAIDQSSTAINGPRISSAIITGNTIDNSATVLGVGSSMADGSAISFSNNVMTNTTGGTPFILYNRSGTSLAGTANSLLLENNTVTGILPAGSVNQLAAFLNLTFNNTVLNPSVIIRGNKINYSGDFSQSQSYFNRPITVRGNIREVTISHNEIEYSGGAMLPYSAASNLPENPAITVNTDWTNLAWMPNEATISITNNSIKGFKQSVVFYDPTSTGKDTYVGYGNIYFGASVSVNTNSFTNDVISINNGTIGAAEQINASCNWFGTASNVAAKVTSEVNVTPWLISGTDAGTEVGFQPLNNVCVGPQTEFYVNDNSNSGDVYTTGIGNDANPGTKEYPFATIGKAIASASAGSTILVDAGLYTENVVVDKSLVLKGAKWGTAPGAELERGAETILLPAVNNITDGTIMMVTASGVTVEGFTFDGDNPSLSGGNNLHGTDVNVARAIANGSAGSGWTAINDLLVQNNIFKNINRNAVHLNSASFAVLTGNVITNNRMDNICSWATGRAILLERNAYATVTDNHITRAVVGIQTSTFNAPSPAPVTIGNNHVEVLLYGVYFLSNSGTAGDFVVENNTINKYPFSSYAATGKPAVEFNNGGLALLMNTGSAAPVFNNNTINGYFIGVFAAQNMYDIPLTINGGAIQNSVNYGTHFTNYFSGSVAGTSRLVLNDVSFLDNRFATFVQDNTANTATNTLELALTGSTTIKGGMYGTAISGSRTSLTGNSISVPFAGQSVAHLYLFNGALAGQQINATGSTFEGIAASSMSLPQLFNLENKIYHKIDQDAAGFIRVKGGEVFITPTSFVAPATKVSLQRAVNAAAEGDVVHLAAGEYPGQVLLNKGLQLKGAGAGQTIVSFDATATFNKAPGQDWNSGIIQSAPGIGNIYIDDITVDGKNSALNTDVSFPVAGILLQTGGAVRNSEIRNMKLTSSFSPEGNGVYVLYDGAEPRNVTVTGNNIKDITWVGLYTRGNNLSASIRNNEIDVTGSSYGMAAAVGGWGSTIAAGDFHNNSLKGFSGFGLQVEATSATISENSFAGIGSAKTIINNGAEINASCNWFGTTAAGEIATNIQGLIAYTPWLTNGTDASDATGFQPNGGACNGTPPVITVDAKKDIGCKGEATGTITISINGGGLPYTYVWTKEGDTEYTASTEDLSGLTAGVYRLTVTDAFGSTTATEVTLSEPAQPLTASASGTNNLCFGESKGSASAAANGGTAPFTYLWSNGALTATVSNLVAGNYAVTVIDVNGCITTASYTVTEPTLLTATVIGTSTNCNNSASVTASGGTAGYTYLWSNGATTASIQDVPAGTYTVTVTDASGCTAGGSVTLDRQAFNPSAQVTNVTCFGGQDGTITITNVNGTAPFTYSINGGAFQASNLFAGLTPGTYTVAVRDANGCMGFATRTVSQPAAIVAEVVSVTNTCGGQSTGAITVSASGGTGGLTFVWTGPNGFSSTKQNITALAAGTYILTVTDKNSCTVQRTATVEAFAAINTEAVITQVLCRGEATGAISQAVSGGSASFQYAWSNGATTKDIANLVAGNYTVTITDATTGCAMSRTYTVTQPASLVSLSTTKTNATGCATMGTITATGSGGTSPYQYRLNNGNYQTAGTFTGLGAGDYTVWVRDANGCTTTKLVNITDNGGDAYETNNSKNGAKTIAIGAIINARIALSTDVADWFMFTTPTGGGQFTLNLQHPTIAYTFDLYPPTKNAAALIPAQTTATTKQYLLAGNTTYYISVTGGLSFTCYNILVNQDTYTTSVSTIGVTEQAIDLSPTTDKLQAQVFPNPHKGVFTIRINSPEEGIARVEIYNATGQRVSDRRVGVHKGNSNTVSFTNMAAGSLFYRVFVGSKEVSGKIIGAK